MNKLLPITLCLILTAGCAMDDRAEADRAADSQAQLSTRLAGYEPDGPPVSCVNMRDLRGNKSAGGAIVFEGTGRGRLWVNNPPGGCPDLGYGRALRTTTPTTQLCRGDIASVVDTVSGFQDGACGLGDFQPYRRVAR
jgi:hypothetical protein